MKIKALFFASLILPVMSTQAAVVVSPTSLTTYEDGSAVTYRVVLDVAPSAGETVTVTPASNDVTEGSISAALTFTAGDFDVPQFITVTPGASGDGNDGDVAYAITNSVTAVGGTASYTGELAADVNPTNRNIEGLNVVILDPPSGAAFFLDEGNSQTVTVSITNIPGADVTIPVSIAGVEAIVSTATVTLNAGNGFSTTFDVTAVADAVVDADQPFTVVLGNTVSADGPSNGLSVPDFDGEAINVDAVIPPAAATPVPALGAVWQLVLAGLLLGFGARRLRKKA